MRILILFQMIMGLLINTASSAFSQSEEVPKLDDFHIQNFQDAGVSQVRKYIFSGRHKIILYEKKFDINGYVRSEKKYNGKSGFRRRWSEYIIFNYASDYLSLTETHFYRKSETMYSRKLIFNKLGNVIEIEKTQFDSLSTVIYKYDSLAHCVEIIKNGAPYNRVLIEYEYDDNNNIVSKKRRDEQGVELTSNFEYYPNGFLKKSVIGDSLRVDELKYNDFGKYSEYSYFIDSISVKSNEFFVVSTCVDGQSYYSYDAKQNLVEIINTCRRAIVKESEFRLLERETYIYTEEGLVEKIEKKFSPSMLLYSKQRKEGDLYKYKFYN